MKNLYLFVICACIAVGSFAQEEATVDTIPDGWRTSGKLTFLINQSAFSNWQAGGDNTFAGNVNLNYDFNYTKGVWLFDNKLIASYGLTNNGDDGMRKSDDRLELNSILGRNINDHWSFSFFMNFKTQFSEGYDYEDAYLDQNPGASNEDFPTSGFFKPAYLSFGPGLLWKKDDNLNVNFAPLTAKFTFITSEIFTYNDDDPDNVRYDSSNDVETKGVAPGDSSLFEFGFNVRGYYKFVLAENVTMENILMLFSDYLDKPQNIYLDYTLNLVLRINDVLSTDLTFQTIYDDNAYSGFQVREVFGLGFNLNF